MIVDPLNPNYAILGDQSLGVAIRAVPEIKDPAAPTLKELQGGRIIGYSQGFSNTERSAE